MSAWQGSTRRSRLPDDWPQRRVRVLQRDRYTCRACGGERCGNRDLEVDHTDRNAGDGYDNLQTLGADPCHREKTQREALAARTPTRRPAERHPGLRT